MKTTIKRNWLVIAMTVLAFCCAFIGIMTFKTDKFNNGEETKVYALSTAVDPTANGTELDAKDYHYFGTDEEFMMLPGASMRVRINDPGLRFTFQIGYGFIEKVSNSYSYDSYEGNCYVKFSRDGLNGKGLPYSDIWVKANPKEKDAFKREANVALTFTGEDGKALTSTQFELARNFEVTATAYYVLTGIQGTAGEGKVYYIKAASNDNTRSMKSVVNAAILAGEEEFYPDLNAMGFVKKDDTHTVTDLTEQVLVDQSALTDNKFTFELPEFSGEIDCAYIGAKKLPATYSEGEVTVDFGSTLNYTGVQLENVKTLSVYNVNGDIWNLPCKYVSKVITEISDLKLFEISTETTLIDGYYILGNDLTPDSLVMVHSGLTDAFRVTYENDYYKAGFCGIFDGEGHVIDGLNLTSCNGIFCHVQNNAQIRNVAFTRVTLNYSKSGVSYTGDYIGNMLLAGFTSCRNYANEYVTFSNIYAQIDSFGSTASTYRSAMVRIADRMKFNSVLVECNASVAYQYDQWGRGVMAANIFEPSSTNGLVVISNNPIASQNYHNGEGVIVSQMTAPENFGLEVGEVCNEFEQPLKVRNVISGTYQWLTYNEMKNDSSSYKTTALSQFTSDLWNANYGIPVWKTLAGSDAYVMINGESTSSVSIINTFDDDAVQPDMAEISVSSPFIGKINTFEIVLKDGENLIQLDSSNNKIIRAVKNAVGLTTATVRITVDGNVIEREITVNVVMPQIKGELRYSTLDNKLYFVGNDKYTLSDITSITTQFEELAYKNGSINVSAMPQNINKTNLSDMTYDVTVEINETIYNAKLISYTMVMTKDTDFAVFNKAQNNLNAPFGSIASPYNPSSVGNVRQGYYILANDITFGSGFTINNGADTNESNVLTYFMGVLDGDGHVLNVNLGHNGLFGYNAGEIKDIAIIVKHLNAVDKTYNGQTIKATQNANTGVVIARDNNDTSKAVKCQLSNVYIEYDCPEYLDMSRLCWGYGATSGIGRIQTNVRLTNVIVNSSKLKTANIYGEYTGMSGSLFDDNYGSGALGSLFSNVYILSDFAYTARLANAENSSSTQKAYSTVNRAHIASNLYDQYIADKAAGNDLGVYAELEGVSKVYKTSNVYSYKSYDYMPRNLASYNNFDTTVWDISSGIPMWKSLDYSLNDFASIVYNGKDLTSSLMIYNAESSDVTQITSANISVKFGGVNYPAILSVVNGAVVGVENDVVFGLADAIGESTVKATVTIGDIIIEKMFTVLVSEPVSAIDAQLRYSTVDGKFYIQDSPIDVTGSITSLIEGGVQKIVNGVYTGEGNKKQTITPVDVVFRMDGASYSTKLAKYEKVIVNEQDFTYFDLTVSGVGGDPYSFNGYYIVNNDINATTKVALHHAIMPRSVGSWNDKGQYFHGVFDGDGHVISNFTLVGNGGIFGRVREDSVFKNFAFVDASIELPPVTEHTQGSDGTDALTFLYQNMTHYYYIRPAFVENAYISIKSIPNKSYYAVIIGNQNCNDTKFSNVVVDIKPSFGNNSWGKGVFGRPTVGSMTFDNAVVISDKWTEICTSNGSKNISYAENEDIEILKTYKNANNESFASGTSVQIEGTLHYTSYEAYKADTAFATASLAKFADSGLWDTSLGYPVFKGMARYDTRIFLNGEEESLALLELGNDLTVSAKYNNADANVAFSIVSGFNKVSINGNIITGVKSGVAVIKATVTKDDVIVEKEFNVLVSDTVVGLGAELRYSSLDGKFFIAGSSEDVTSKITSLIVDGSETIVSGSYNGYAYMGTEKDIKDVLVVIDGVLYKAQFAKYAKVLTTEQDFTCFDLTTQGTSISGYYILNNDIDATEEVAIHHAGLSTSVITLTSDTNFMGTFDGDGHVVKNFVLKSDRGLFGQAYKTAVIKNVAFDNAKIVNNPKGSLEHNLYDDTFACFLYSISQGSDGYVQIKDCYFSFGPEGFNATYVALLVGPSTAEKPAFTNVIVQTDKSFGNGNWGRGIVGNQKYGNATFDNFVVIGDKNVYINAGVKAGKQISIGANQTIEEVKNLESAYDNDGITIVTVFNTLKYGSIADFGAAISDGNSLATNSLAKFAASGMWDTTGDYPVFIGMAD